MKIAIMILVGLMLAFIVLALIFIRLFTKTDNHKFLYTVFTFAGLTILTGIITVILQTFIIFK